MHNCTHLQKLIIKPTIQNPNGNQKTKQSHNYSDFEKFPEFNLNIQPFGRFYNNQVEYRDLHNQRMDYGNIGKIRNEIPSPLTRNAHSA